MASTSQTVIKYQKKNDNKNFQNWIKASLIISFVKEGITQYVNTYICRWHHEIFCSDEPCSDCTIENVLPCKTRGICSMNKSKCRFHSSEVKKFKSCSFHKGVKDIIVKSHNSKKPSWSNTRAERWSDHPWEIAKCYMPPNAYAHTNTPQETDLNGILSVIINHKAFREMFDLQECEEIRKMVNNIRHAADLLLTEEELNETTYRMTDFLSRTEHIRNDENVLEAIQNIKKFRSSQVAITSNEVSTILQEVIEKNSNICQSMTSLLQEAIETLERERSQEIDTLDEIFVLLRDILHAVQFQNDVKHPSPSTSTRTNQQITETEYQHVKQLMKSDLIKFNKQRHSSILLSPLFGESDTSLVDFYVFPKMEIVDNQQVMFKGRPNGKRKCITSLHDVFYKDRKTCREIYVTSESGVGKSAFCKRLSVTWCLSNQSEVSDYFSEEDLQVLKQYDFFFLILLRDTTSDTCAIEDMIQNHIINHLDHSNKYTIDILEEILSRESCLIVLDGLDEWFHQKGNNSCKTVCSDIPQRKAWKHSTLLTTSRPWKFNDINLKSSQVDQVIEIQRLDSDTSEKLTFYTLSKLIEEETGERNASQAQSDAIKFNTEIENKSISLFTPVPLILTYVVCLWRVYGQSLGHSKCEIYSNLIGLLLNQAEQRRNNDDEFEGQQRYKKRKLSMPSPIASNEFCAKHYEFLLNVGRLAFETYFAFDREKSFVFEKGIATSILTKNELKLCFEVGFLTQSKNLDVNILKRSKLSFREQTLQEFFTALYIQSAKLFSRVIRTITSVCFSVENILPVSNVLIFLSGLNPLKARDLSKKLNEFAVSSDIARGYRCDMGSWNYFVGYNRTMKAYQTMHVSSVEEFRENFTDKKSSFKLYLEDYFIDTDFEDAKYSRSLEALLEMNKTQVKSIKMRDIKTKENFHKVIDILKHNNSLEKIDIKCEIDETDLEEILAFNAKCIKCFILKGGRWIDNEWQHSHISLSEKSLISITNASQLENLYLRNLKLTHSQIHRLFTYISNQENMKHIGIAFIKCIDHAKSCPGVKFDLRKHTELKMIEMVDSPFSWIDINTDSLEVCYLGPSENEEVYSSVLKRISEASRLEVFCTGFLKGSDIDHINRCIPSLKNVKHIWLNEMDLGDRKLELGACTSIDFFVMIKVKMTCETFKTLVESLRAARQNIKIGLFDCSVVPEDTFKAVKEIMKKSPFLSVILDGKDEIGRSELLLGTTADCS